MPLTLPKKVLGGYGRDADAEHSHGGLLEASVFVVLVFAAVASTLPASLVLAAASLVIILCGLLLGASALAMSHFRGLRQSRLLEIAGVLVFFGFAAAIIADQADALHLLTGRKGV